MQSKPLKWGRSFFNQCQMDHVSLRSLGWIQLKGRVELSPQAQSKAQLIIRGGKYVYFLVRVTWFWIGRKRWAPLSYGSGRISYQIYLHLKKWKAFGIFVFSCELLNMRHQLKRSQWKYTNCSSSSIFYINFDKDLVSLPNLSYVFRAFLRIFHPFVLIDVVP